MATALLRHPFQTMRSVALSSILVLNVLRIAEAGTVLLGGDDLTDHGRFNATTGENEQGWKYIEHAMAQLIADSTFPERDGSVALLGSYDSTKMDGGNAGAAYHWAAYANDNTLVRYYNQVAGLNTFFANLSNGEVKPSLVALAGSEAQNDLWEGESDVITANWQLLKQYIDDGGSLMSHTGDHVYGWLSNATNVTEVKACRAEGAFLTTDGRAMFPQLRDSDINIDAGPCHNYFRTASGFQTLAKDGWGRDYIIMSRGAIEEIPIIRVNCSDETMTAQAGTWRARAHNSWDVSFSVPRQTHGRDFERFMQTALNNDNTFRARGCRASHPGVLQIAMPRENVADATLCFESDCWSLEEFTLNGLDCPSTPTCPECDGVEYSPACDQNGKLYPNECTLNRLACLFPGEPLELTECPPTPAPTVAPTATPPTALPTLAPLPSPEPTAAPATPQPLGACVATDSQQTSGRNGQNGITFDVKALSHGVYLDNFHIQAAFEMAAGFEAFVFFSSNFTPEAETNQFTFAANATLPKTSALDIVDLQLSLNHWIPANSTQGVYIRLTYGEELVYYNGEEYGEKVRETDSYIDVFAGSAVSHDRKRVWQPRKFSGRVCYTLPVDMPTPIATSSPTNAPSPLPTPIPTNSPSPTPTFAPSPVPTDAPTPMPSDVPTPMPTDMPTPTPTNVPSPVPTYAPTPTPTLLPTPAPTDIPTPLPTFAPTPVPTFAPSPTPTNAPTPMPSNVPSPMPTNGPSPTPTNVPTPTPTFGPTPSPTVLPTPMPTHGPSPAPTTMPTPTPTFGPTPTPTVLPTPMPTGVPTPVPTDMPTPTPTGAPTPGPTFLPTPAPTNVPSPAPTNVPSPSPTHLPTAVPSPDPTVLPTAVPTPKPLTAFPSPVPSVSPTSAPSPTPTDAPTPGPTVSPTPAPSLSPTPVPTGMPSPAPTDAPTPVPTNAPSPAPTTGPTPAPTNMPSPAPTNIPTPTPTDAPTPTPTDLPTPVPTVLPTPTPTNAPTPVPTYAPTPVPTDMPTPMPTGAPTPMPTALPTPAPTQLPTPVPTDAPTPVPTVAPTPVPTDAPSPMPTSAPSPVPTDGPTPVPTDLPTPSPTDAPSPMPTSMPSPVPTDGPTPVPTDSPTPSPTVEPTPVPTSMPSPVPTNAPTPTPTAVPTAAPTAFPTPAPAPWPTTAPTQYTDAPTTIAATDALFTAFPTPEVTASPTPAPVEPTRPADAAGGVSGDRATTTTGSSTIADLSDAALGGIVVGAIAGVAACCAGLFFVGKRLRGISSSD